MNTKETAAAQAAAGANAPKSETTGKASGLPKVNVEKSEIEILREKLQAELDRLNKKSQVASLRAQFIATRDKIKNFSSEMVANKNDSFSNEEARLTLNVGRYRDDKAISIASFFVLERFCKFIDEEIEAKILSLENQLLED